MSKALLMISEKKEKRLLHATASRAFNTITRNVNDLGMMVNPNKTQLLCVIGLNYAESSSFIRNKN